MLRILIGIVLPFVLVLTNVRLLLTPGFVSMEYSTPGFPPDPYGFTQDDRKYWATLSLEYLLGDFGLEFFENLRLEDGQPVYNERELSHIVDVKRLVQRAVSAWAASAVTAGILIAVAWRWGGWPMVRRGLSLGARLTLILMGAVLGLVILAFPLFFEFGFHRVLFAQGTYLFYYSDTFIRLFPLRFWRDAFALVALLTLVEAGVLLWLTRRRASPSAGPRAEQSSAKH